MKVDIMEEAMVAEPADDLDPSSSKGQHDAQPTPRKDSARAAENIVTWRSYLPEDCVKTMISMGWHGTT